MGRRMPVIFWALFFERAPCAMSARTASAAVFSATSVAGMFSGGDVAKVVIFPIFGDFEWPPAFGPCYALRVLGFLLSAASGYRKCHGGFLRGQ